ncbi:MAG: N-acetylmuramoyl-L-alanine amidase [Oscillibacter sp.]|nr:N-acetylmuramoyl-L-alanine amidase [Oscillibacter sp.]
MRQRCLFPLLLAVMLCLCGCASTLHGYIETMLGADTPEEAAIVREEVPGTGDHAQQEREAVSSAADSGTGTAPETPPTVPVEEDADAPKIPETQPESVNDAQAWEPESANDAQAREPENTDTLNSSVETPLPLTGRVICLDPGHGVTPLIGKGYVGPVSPLSDETKPLYTAGTEGAHMTEEELNLIVGLKLRDALEALGAEILMTRTVSEIAITGVERCEIANRAGADVHIHIHADGVDNASAHGVSVLVPAKGLLGTPSILEESVRLGKFMVDAVAERTGAKNRGISPRSDMTGFNFSEVPSVLIEMGFMTNPQEDALLESGEYQDRIVEGIVDSLFAWYGIPREN